MGEGISTAFLVAVPSAISPEPQTPVSLHTTPVHSNPPPPEARVSGGECHFVHRPFKSVTVSPADSYLFLANKIPTDFYNQMLRGCLFLAVVL